MIYQNAVAEPRENLTDFVQEGVADDTEFQGLKLAPELPVSELAGFFPKITIAKGDLMRAANRRRAPGTNFNRWQMAIESGTLSLESIGEEESIPDEINMRYDDYFDIEAIGANEATNRLKRGHEIDVAAALMNSGNFTAANGSVAYAIGNKTTINFVADVLAAIRAIKARGERPDTIVIPGVIYDVLIQTTLLKEFLVGTLNPGVNVDADNLQKAFARNGIKQVIVPDSYVNQSDSNKSDVINPIWGDDYVWVGKIGSGPLRNGGWGRTAYWDKAGPLFNISTYREEVKKSNIVRSEKTAEVIVTNGRAGQLIGTQV